MTGIRPTPLETLLPRSHALVTGGSSGIGLEVARELLGLGGRVHLVARNPERLERARLDLKVSHPGQQDAVHLHPCDVTSQEEVAALFRKLASNDELPSVVVNSAGMTRPAYFQNHTADDFRDIMEVNFTGTLHVLMETVPVVMEKREGYILNVSSVAGLMGVFGMTAYCSAKFAVRGLTEALRSEMKPHGVVVSLLCPPDTETPMLRDEVPQRPPETEALSPSKNAISPEQVARAAVRGLARGKARILPGSSAWLPALAQRLSPGGLEWAMDRVVRKAKGGGSHAP